MSRIRTLGLGTITLILAASILEPGRSDATTAAAQLSIEELSDLSNAVVQGTVTNINSFRKNDRIFTDIEVAVTETLKGTPAQTARLRLYGGTYEGVRTTVIGGPCFSTGEEVVLFLKTNTPSTYDVVNLAEGKFEVFLNTDGSRGVRRDLRGISYLDGTVPPLIPKSFDELKAAVEAATR